MYILVDNKDDILAYVEERDVMDGLKIESVDLAIWKSVKEGIYDSVLIV